MLCSVVKHLGSCRALKKWGKTLDCVSCFSLHFVCAVQLPASFPTEQNTVEATLFVTKSIFFLHNNNKLLQIKLFSSKYLNVRQANIRLSLFLNFNFLKSRNRKCFSFSLLAKLISILHQNFPSKLLKN